MSVKLLEESQQEFLQESLVELLEKSQNECQVNPLNVPLKELLKKIFNEFLGESLQNLNEFFVES